MRKKYFYTHVYPVIDRRIYGIKSRGGGWFRNESPTIMNKTMEKEQYY